MLYKYNVIIGSDEIEVYEYKDDVQINRCKININTVLGDLIPLISGYAFLKDSELFFEQASLLGYEDEYIMEQLLLLGDGYDKIKNSIKIQCRKNYKKLKEHPLIFNHNEHDKSLYIIDLLQDDFVLNMILIQYEFYSLNDLKKACQYYNTKIDYDFMFEDSKEFQRYVCYNLRGILLSIIHYFKSMNKKKANCSHCGKVFFTDTLKEKYCYGNSPCIGYEHLPCKQAVKNIRQECTRIKNRIETKSTQHYTSKTKNDKYSNLYSTFNTDFNKLCEPYQIQISKTPTSTLQQEYLSFLRKTDKNKEWLK